MVLKDIEDNNRQFMLVNKVKAILVWAWLESDNYWPAYFGLYKRVKIAFDAADITIPFPQRVHIHPFSGD